MNTVFRLLARAVSGGTGVLLIGGYALQAHGVSRQTVDVDALIAAENLPESLCRQFGPPGIFDRLKETL